MAGGLQRAKAHLRERRIAGAEPAVLAEQADDGEDAPSRPAARKQVDKTTPKPPRKSKASPAKTPARAD